MGTTIRTDKHFDGEDDTVTEIPPVNQSAIHLYDPYLTVAVDASNLPVMTTKGSAGDDDIVGRTL